MRTNLRIISYRQDSILPFFIPSDYRNIQMMYWGKKVTGTFAKISNDINKLDWGLPKRVTGTPLTLRSFDAHKALRE
jgi:hypothetical protein